MEAILEDYLAVYRQGCAPTTARRVGIQLTCFLRFLRSQGVRSMCAISPEHVLGYLSELSRRSRPQTLAPYASVMRLFLRWLYLEKHLWADPWPRDLEMRRVPYYPRPVPSQKTLRRLLECPAAPRMHYPVRNRAILELAYGSGLRRVELQRLNLSDMRGEWLHVLGKGGRERLVPLHKTSLDCIALYLRTERLRIVGRHNPHEEALFVSRHGRRLGLFSFNYLMGCYRPRKSPYTLHSLRHACATHMLESGASIRVLQQLLGHRSLSSTQIYTRVQTSSLKKLLESYHPRG